MNMETQIREALARGYCSPENEHKILDPVLIEAMTRELLQSFTPAETDKTEGASKPKVKTPYWSTINRAGSDWSESQLMVD